MAGGWLMLPLFVLALILYISALRLWLHVRSINQLATRPLVLTRPQQAGDTARSTPEQIHSSFHALQQATTALIDRRLCFIATLVTIAPLAGLLGTVSGMLVTFSALSRNTGQQTLDLVASGISEALITTQAGLMIAIPGYVLLEMVRRQRNQWQATLSRMESTLLQQVAFAGEDGR